MEITKGQREKAYKLTNGRCAYCGCQLDPKGFHVDHIIPKAKGGKMHDNLVASCQDCNLAKCDMTIEEFRNEISSLFESVKNKKLYHRVLRKYYGDISRPIEYYFETIASQDKQES